MSVTIELKPAKIFKNRSLAHFSAIFRNRIVGGGAKQFPLKLNSGHMSNMTPPPPWEKKYLNFLERHCFVYW